MKNTNNTDICTFNKESDYKKKVAPLVQALITQCELLDIPMFVSCCVKSTPTNTFYRNGLACSPESRQIPLKYDQITRHVGVCAGFEITPRRFQDEMDEDFSVYEERLNSEDVEAEINEILSSTIASSTKESSEVYDETDEMDEE